MCHSLFEALARGTATEQMENEATDAIELATHMAMQLIREANSSDLSQARRVLSKFKTHCETWDVVNNQELNPAIDIFNLFKGFVSLKL